VRDPEGAWEKSGSRLEADWKSFGADGKQKDLASMRALCPHAHSVLFRQKWALIKHVVSSEVELKCNG